MTSRNAGTTDAATPKSAAPKLNADERKVLRYLVNNLYEEYCSCFDPICKSTKLSRPRVRLACRSLKRKGLARFESGLWTEDGTPAGSGYGVTRAGVTVIKPPRPAGSGPTSVAAQVEQPIREAE